MEAQKVESTSGEMVTEKVNVIWRIENFARVRKLKAFRDRQKLRFQVKSNLGLTSDWLCTLFQRKEYLETPEGWQWKKVGYMRVCLERIPPGVTELVASLKVTTKTEVGSSKQAVEWETRATNRVRTLGWGLLKLRGYWNINDIWTCPLINGCLVLDMELTLMKLKEARQHPQLQSMQQIEALFKPTFTEKLQQDFGKLLEGHGKTDAKILTKDEVEFAVHRCILSERSPVFETMFQTPMTEAQTGIVLIPDLSSKTMAVLLQYIYSGTLYQDWSEEQVLPELVYAASKYGLQELVDFLDQAVGRVCSKNNAGRLLSLLGKLGMRKGEREVLNFIKTHLESFEDMAKFVEEGIQQPDIKSKKSGVFRRIFGSVSSTKLN